MCGVTRLSLTLAVILFELTGSLDYVLPFSLTILVAKWTADAIEPSSIYVCVDVGLKGGCTVTDKCPGPLDKHECISIFGQQT